MNIRDILREHLKAMDCDGLCNSECGCDISDLMPCEESCGNCEPAYRYVCPHCEAECWGVPNYNNTEAECFDCGVVYLHKRTPKQGGEE